MERRWSTVTPVTPVARVTLLVRCCSASAMVLVQACAQQPSDRTEADAGRSAGRSAAVPDAPLPDSAFPPTEFGRAALRGRAILTATRESLPDHVGNGLRCISCHLDEGRRPFAMPLMGAYARYPQYRSRSGTVQSLEDRINDCFERSMGGSRLPVGDARLQAIVAYFAYLSHGVPAGAPMFGQGLDSVQAAHADTAHGRRVFRDVCSRCHGEDASRAPIPLWGERSYSVGAGMARTRAAAAFIRRNMPYDQRGTLSQQDALDVAAYVNAQPRRDFGGKHRDWPRGDAPPDVPYATARRKAP